MLPAINEKINDLKEKYNEIIAKGIYSIFA